MASTQNKQRTYARNRTFSRKGNEKITESDGAYILKLVLFILLGSLWLKFKMPLNLFGAPLYGAPVGLIFGLILVHKFEKYQFNRKIWYAILIIVAIVSFFLPSGIVI